MTSRRRLEMLLRTYEKLLRDHYGSPRHGNKSNPLSELIYIMLSAQTDADKCTSAYLRLRRRCGCWSALKDLSEQRIGHTIAEAGLGKVRAKRLREVARRLHEDFGEVSLRYLKRMNWAEAEDYLVSLPGVGRKTARCVLMYSLGAPVFPVDAHSFRCLRRMGIHSLPPPIRRWENRLQSLVPTDIRYSLHVTLVSLGREYCVSDSPRCEQCPVAAVCPRVVADTGGDG